MPYCVFNIIDKEFSSPGGRKFLENKVNKPISHGMLSGSLFSSILSKAFELPVYLSQNLEFKSPVFYDQELAICIFFKSVKPKVISFF